MKLMTIFLMLFFTTSVFSQEKKSDIPHQFEIIKKVPASSVKSQGRTSTCWAFATTSFIAVRLTLKSLWDNYGNYEYLKLKDIVNNFMLMYQGNHALINNIERLYIKSNKV